MADNTGTIPEQPETTEASRLVAPPEYASELRQEAKEWRIKFQETERKLAQLMSDKQRTDAEAKGDYEAALKAATDRAAELETRANAAERYQDAITKLLEAQKKDVPPHIDKLLAKLDPVEQLEWLAENAESLKPEPVETEPAQQAGRASFNPAGQKQQETDRQRLARLSGQRGIASPFG